MTQGPRKLMLCAKYAEGWATKQVFVNQHVCREFEPEFCSARV